MNPYCGSTVMLQIVVLIKRPLSQEIPFIYGLYYTEIILQNPTILENLLYLRGIDNTGWTP